MRRVVLLFLVFFLGFGCLADRNFQGTKNEIVSNTEQADLDKDGINDYAVYDFEPVDVPESGFIVKRQITVSVDSVGSFTQINPNLTDVDLLLADQKLEEFSKSRITADSACSQAIGLGNVVCVDKTTCARLCSAASSKCKNISAKNDEVLAGSMISYVQADNEIRSLTLDARRMVLTLRNTTDEQRNAFLGKIRGIVSGVGSINANPLYTYDDFAFCQHSDFGVNSLVEAVGIIGAANSEPDIYRYRVILSVKPADSTDKSGIREIGLSDRIPGVAGLQPGQISSMQSINISSGDDIVVVNWTSSKPNKDGYLFEYEFESSKPPEDVIESLKTPDLRVKRIW